MKPFYYILALIFVALTQEATSQPPERRALPRQQQAENKNTDLPSLSVRAEAKNQEQIQNIDNAPWRREIYRWIDLTKDDNAALYYPTQPIGERMNLFTVLFKLVGQGKVKAYNYLEGREVFTDKNLALFDNILKRLDVTYTSQKNGSKVEFSIDENDIPSNEITLYLVKEIWYFDKSNGTFNSSIAAICPTMVRQEDEFSEPLKTPVFWVVYDDIRPYLAQHLIMTSNMNNAMTNTMDDYFRKRMYKGDIVKTTNMMNKSLAQIVGNKPDRIKRAQDSIENQLKAFEKNLWVQPDTAKAVAASSKDKKKESTSTRSVRGKSSSSSSSSSDNQQKATKTKSEKTTPTKSVRRTR